MAKYLSLRFEAEGASREQLQAAVNAATSVFQAAGIHPQRAANGVARREAWDIAGFPEDGADTLSKEDGTAADAWDMAEIAAIKACFGAPISQDAPEGHLVLQTVDTNEPEEAPTEQHDLFETLEAKRHAA